MKDGQTRENRQWNGGQIVCRDYPADSTGIKLDVQARLIAEPLRGLRLKQLVERIGRRKPRLRRSLVEFVDHEDGISRLALYKNFKYLART